MGGAFHTWHHRSVFTPGTGTFKEVSFTCESLKMCFLRSMIFKAPFWIKRKEKKGKENDEASCMEDWSERPDWCQSCPVDPLPHAHTHTHTHTHTISIFTDFRSFAEFYFESYLSHCRSGLPLTGNHSPMSWVRSQPSLSNSSAVFSGS